MHSTGRRRQHKKAPLQSPLNEPEADCNGEDANVTSQLCEAMAMDNVSLSSEDESMRYMSCSPVDQTARKSNLHGVMDASDGSSGSVATIGVTASDSKVKVAAGTGPSALHTETGRPRPTVNKNLDDEIYKECKSFLLADQNENIKVGC